MAVVKMQKLTLAAHKKDRRKIMSVLTRLGTAEIVKSERYENTESVLDGKLKEEIERKLGILNFVFGFFKDAVRDASKEYPDIVKQYGKINLGRENKLIDYDDLAESAKDEYDVYHAAELIQNINSSLVDIKTEKARLISLFQQISDYRMVNVKFSELKSTSNVFITAGLIPAEKADNLKKSLPENAVLELSFNDKTATVVVIAHHSLKKEVSEALTAADFSRCPFEYDVTASEMLDQISDKLTALEKKKKELYVQAFENIKMLEEFKLLYDYLLLENTKLMLLSTGSETGKAFVLDAWIPAHCAENTVKELKDCCPDAEYILRDPLEGETVPSFVVNSKPVSSFGDVITSTFGYPKYGAIDPNPFVAFFYFLFFGFMLSDAGYGLIIASFCFGMLLIKKPVKNSGSFLLMFGLCGVSTMIWGAVFGGWFGIEANILETFSVGRFLLKFKLLDPLDGQQTLIMFIMALGMGVIQICTGFFLNGLSKMKTAPLDGLFNDMSWVIIFAGGGMYVSDMFIKTGIISTVGIVIAGIGLLFLLAGGALGKKNPLKMLLGAFKNVYGSINVLSDILSYARLFGLGLTTGVIGLVINRIGGIIIDLVPYHIGYIFAIPVLVGGHLFNLGINTLGVYVHNSRLQYVEFFGKFYTGEGKAFNPLGSKTKYVFLKDHLSKNKKQNQSIGG